ncbi:DUF1631 domain-containing protein [Corallococcus exiguus]|uniref:Uncharacterized protein n=1 Tax=Corallococcus exiguus TaxID=83462 RepID=A0A7X5BP79_9BACT|nr:DUF1631 domain-containing protein [Corallococcus exiguus]NBC40246.1 hypothetical protein [Corallococcus exiguus]TNV66406.1 DUF1631 domain-containing protein [Corallococcus exiguus]
MRIEQFLNSIKTSSPGWEPGDNLATLQLTDSQLGQLNAWVVERAHKVKRLRDEFRVAWGAAMLLAGARAIQRLFRENPDARIEYANVGVKLGIDRLDLHMNADAWSAIEAGSRQVWGVRLMRSRAAARRVLETMLLHSGAFWPLLEVLAEEVERSWSWESLVHADQQSIAAWMGNHAKLLQVREGLRSAFRDEDTRLELADHLQRFAEVKAFLAQCTAIPLASGALTEVLGAPSDEAASVLAARLAPSATTEQAQWHWDTRNGLDRLLLRLPKLITVPAAGPKQQRLLLGFANGTIKVAYSRHGERYEREAGTSSLPLPRATEFPAALLASDEHGEFEVPYMEIDAPADLVALFDADTGEQLSCASAGTTVVLVCAPRCRLNAPDGFKRRSTADLDAWSCKVPSHAQILTLNCPDGSVEEWSLDPKGIQLRIVFEPSHIPGLAFGRAAAYLRFPRFFVDGDIRTFSYRLVGPAGEQSGTLRNRIVRPVQKLAMIPGRYRLEVFADGRSGFAHFVIVPEGTAITSRSDNVGTHIAVSGGDLVLLTHTTEQARALTLNDSVHGKISINVFCRRAGLHGAYSVGAYPLHVEVRKASDSEATDERAFELLLGSGGLQIEGPPGAEVRIVAGEATFIRYLDSTGHRFIRFSELPRRVFQVGDGGLRLRVHVGSWHSDALHFSRRTARRLNVIPELRGGIWYAHTKLPDPPPVYFEFVSAWAPWIPPQRIEATVVARDEGGFQYEVLVPASGHPYQVTAFSGAERISGMGLFNSHAGRSPAPPKLDPLERLLWEGTEHKRELWRDAIERRLATHHEQWVFDTFKTLRRFGSRWFRIAEHLLDAMTHLRLGALVVPTEESDDVEAVFRDLDWPLARVRYADFQRVAPSDPVVALKRIAEWNAGLLVPAFLRWDPRERYMDVARLLAPLHEAPRLLSNAEINVVCSPDAEGVRNVINGAASGRFFGLVEIRRKYTELSADSDLRGLTVRDDNAEGVHARLRAIWQQVLPPDAREIENAVVNVTERVHRWRAGGPALPRLWDDVRVLQRSAPTLFDYWLNRWAAEGTEK